MACLLFMFCYVRIERQQYSTITTVIVGGGAATTTVVRVHRPKMCPSRMPHAIYDIVTYQVVPLVFGVETVLWPTAAKKGGKWYRGVVEAAE